MLSQQISGNFELNVIISGVSKSATARVYFSGENTSTRAYLEIEPQGFKIFQEIDGECMVLKDYPDECALPWRIRVLKKGNFFRFWINNKTGWIRGPLGEWENIYEPWNNHLQIVISRGCVVDSCTVTTLPRLQSITQPVISRGPAGSHYEQQIIPGAIIEFEGCYYMYCMAGMRGKQEGSSRRSIGVAVSDDLVSWEMKPKPVLKYTDFPGDNIYPNGAVVMDNGQVAIVFCAQQFPEWLGFMLATSDDPLGPFTPYENNPVYKHFTPFAHEFDLIRANHPDYKYILFYAGDTPNPAINIPRSDRGYLLYSDDLIHWREDENNPVFDPETVDGWDTIHVRPRSLNKIGDMWYLWYEGCNVWTPPGFGKSVWCDTIGLARSPDLYNWSYHPGNPALPALGISPHQFDNTWTGWPRMVVKDGIGYVFYTGNAQVGLRTIPIDQLTNWESEGGETFQVR